MVDRIEDGLYGTIDKETGKLLDIRQSPLEEIYKVYKRYFHIENMERIDVVLAIAKSRELEGIPLWLILVGPSGDMKSVQLNSLCNENTFTLNNLTSKTLVNGYRDKLRFPDLAPELDGKIVIIPDMAQILKLPPNEKGELWGQLRDLYDGFAGKLSGMGSRAHYEGLKVTLLAGSTPSIDGQILVHQDLGTRELIYRTKGNIKKKESMKRCFENEEFEKRISEELRQKTNYFLENTFIKRDYIRAEIQEELMRIAIYITYMRATAEFDGYTNDLRNEVYPEEPTRIAKQLKRLYICLTNLSDNYPEERALKILWDIAKSSAFPLRIKIFNYLLLGSENSTSDLSERLCVGKSTIKRECSVLWNMNLLNCRREPINSNYSDKTYDYWSINKNHEFVKNLLNST